MACAFPTSSTYGISGFPGTPEEYMTSYPLSSATGGPMGPSAGPTTEGICCANGQKAGPCSAIGKVCQAGGQIGDCVGTSQCTGNISLPAPKSNSWILYAAVIFIFLALLYFFLWR